MKKGFMLKYQPNNGNMNMDLDERIFNFVIENAIDVPVVRFYGWTPACISLGRNQDDDFIDKKFCKKKGVHIVRRLTGGTALYHDKELSYSFISPISFLKNGESVVESCREIGGALSLGFSKLGLNVGFVEEKKKARRYEYCMSLSTSTDLAYKDKKIVGSAQYRKDGYLLQQGSILLDYDKFEIHNLFGEKPSDRKITTLKKVAPKVTGYALEKVFRESFSEYFEMEFIPIFLEDQNVERLLRQDICV